MSGKIDVETCYKYLVFLNEECDRFLRDEGDDEDKIAGLKIEFDRFIERVKKSNLPKDLKKKILDLELDYEYDPHQESKNLVHFALFGQGSQRRRERKLNDAVEALKFDIKGLPMYIQLNY